MRIYVDFIGMTLAIQQNIMKNIIKNWSNHSLYRSYWFTY